MSFHIIILLGTLQNSIISTLKIMKNIFSTYTICVHQNNFLHICINLFYIVLKFVFFAKYHFRSGKVFKVFKGNFDTKAMKRFLRKYAVFCFFKSLSKSFILKEFFLLIYNYQRTVQTPLTRVHSISETLSLSAKDGALIGVFMYSRRIFNL